MKGSWPAAGGMSRYRIHAQGRVAQVWFDAFEKMAITTAVGADGTCLTTLEGALPDQAALVGILNSLHDLHMILVGVERLPDQ